MSLRKFCFQLFVTFFSGGKQEFAKGENERDHSDLAHDAGSDFVAKNGTTYHLVAGLGLLYFFIFFSCNTTQGSGECCRGFVPQNAC